MEKKTKEELHQLLEATALEDLPTVWKELEADSRRGVQQLVVAYQKKYQKYQKELERLDQMLVYERSYQEYARIAGMDEAGRGPLAGPVVAAAVILPKEEKLLYVNDSKQLSESKREELYEVIQSRAISVGVGVVGPERIDEINILQATYEAMRRAVAGLSEAPELLLNDAVLVPGLSVKQVPIIKGDAKSLSIAAASIIAKVTRDCMMREYEGLYPQYGFARNKGYGSQEHIRALQEYGPSPIHRKTFIGHFIPTGCGSGSHACKDM